MNRKLGKFLRMQREVNNLTTRQVTSETGITNVSRYETGESRILFENAVKLAKCYGCDIDEMVELV